MIQPFLAGLFVLAAPGYALLLWLPDRFDLPTDPRRDGLARLADSLALSVALTALLGMAALLAGIHYSTVGLWAFYAVCGLLILAGWARRMVSGWRGARPTAAVLLRAGWGLLAVAGLAALIAWRWFQARDLALPAWVDSVHHTLIVRKIMENGGVPWDLRPYLDIPFYYHYGFHLVTALFSTLAGWNAAQGVLWFGQVINAGVALSVYRLGMAFAPARCAENAREWNAARWRAGIAALLVGFTLQMPAYYLTWGRYTLLTGLLLMGPAMAAAYEIWRNPADRGAMVRYVALLAGIFTTHYLVVVLVAFFLVALGVGGLWRWAARRNWRAFPWPLIVGGLLAVLLAAPWLWRLIGFNLHTEAASVQVVGLEEGSTRQTTTPAYLNYLLFLLGPRHNYILLGIALIGLLFSLRHATLRFLAAWTLLVMLFSQPWGLRIGPFRPDLYIIVLFFPAALFLADLLLWASQTISAVWRPWAGPAVLVLITALLVGWGMWQTRDVLNRATIFVTQADVAALDWINHNIPPDARFYINAAPWQTSAYRGVDGGYWLMPYTGRASLIPPVIYGYGSPEMVQAVANLAQRTARVTGCTPDFWTLVRDAALTHVYLREGSGTLQPSMLQDCKRLRQIYAAGGVYVYEILFP